MIETYFISTEYLSANGEKYRISVSYGTETGLPMDAELWVRELEDSGEIAEYLGLAGTALGEDAAVGSYARLFDISLVKDGVELHPAEGTTVSVRITLEDAEDAAEDGLNVMHFAEDEATAEITAEILDSEMADGEDLPESGTEAAPEAWMDALPEEEDAAGKTVHFEVDGFSVFMVFTVTTEDAEEKYQISFDIGYTPTKDTNDNTMPAFVFTHDGVEYKYICPGDSGNTGSDHYDKEQDRFNFEIKPGDSIQLPKLQRFGYNFDGWFDDASGGQEINVAEDGSYTVPDTETGTNTTFYAHWKPDSYLPLQFTLGGEAQTGVPVENIEISFDNGNTWYPFSGGTDGKSAVYQVDPYDKILSLVDSTLTINRVDQYKIQYGETLGNYFKRIGLTESDQYLPILKDNREENADKVMAFSNWYEGTFIFTPSTTYSLGSMFGKQKDASSGNDSLQATHDFYHNSNTVSFKDQWASGAFSLYRSGDSNGWTWSYIEKDAKGEEVETPIEFDENGKAAVRRGATVKMSVPEDSSQYISHWSLKDGNGNVITPEEQAHKTGVPLCYYFTMPAAMVNAVYRDPSSDEGSTTYIDLGQSPITFAENVKYNNHEMNGFWYKKIMSPVTYTANGGSGESISVNAMTPLFGTADLTKSETYGSLSDVNKKGGYEWYFYPMNTDVEHGGGPFYVTSQNKETQNQLRLVNAATVCFKACNLTATEDYKNGAKHLYFGNNQLPFNGYQGKDAFAGYANVILDNEKYEGYDAKLIFQGENTVCCIAQSKLMKDQNHQGTLTLSGKNGTLNLGSAYMDGNINTSGLDIQEIPDDPSDYLLCMYPYYATYAGISINGGKISAGSKWLYAYNSGNISVSGNADVTIGYIYTGNTLTCGGNSHTHVTRDALAGKNFKLEGQASAVVDGNLLNHEYDNMQSPYATISTTKYLIVKGNRCEFGNLAISRGTVIANNLEMAYKGSITGGTIITNQLSNYLASKGSVNYTDGNMVQTALDSGSKDVKVESNTSGAPFKTHASAAPASDENSFLYLKGGKIYLAGDYRASEGYFDLGFTTASDGNPIGGIITKLGTLNAGTQMPSETELESWINDLITQRRESSASMPECVILGKSEYNTSEILRTFKLLGSEIYAAGNVNFYNNVDMSGGIVNCAGDFSSALDLDITGGTVAAGGTVGNSSALPYTDAASKLSRYPELNISKNATVTAAKLGASSTDSRSHVTIDGTGTTITLTESGQNVCTDLYINYAIGEEFNNPSTNPVFLRYQGTYSDGVSWAGMAWKLSNEDLSALGQATFAAPEPAGGSGSGKWSYMSLDGGLEVEATTSEGYISYKNTKKNNETSKVSPSLEETKYVVFYALKDAYALRIKEGYEQIGSSTVSGGSVTFEKEDGSESYTATVPTGANVVLAIDSKMAGKAVAWYYDANGLLHNVMPDETDSAANLSFTMPFADTEVFITDELELYLDKYEIRFMKDGFQVEMENTRADSVFGYKGSYKITQSNIKSLTVLDPAENYSQVTKYSIDGKSYKSGDQNDEVKKQIDKEHATYNRICFDSGSGNWDGEGSSSELVGRTYKLSGIAQQFPSATEYSLLPGIILSDGEKAAIEVEGVNVLRNTHVPVNSSIYYYGDNNQEDKIVVQRNEYRNYSALSFVGWNMNPSAQASGNARFENLRYQQCANNVAMGRSSGKQSSFTVNNCVIMLHSFYEGSGLGAGYNEACINNSKITIYSGGDINPAPFDGTKDVKIESSSVTYQVGGNRRTGGFFLGVDSMAISGTAEKPSNVQIKDRYSDSTTRTVRYTGSCAVTIGKNASVTAERRLRLAKLVLDGGSLTVTGKDEAETGGYFFCPDITVKSGGQLAADYILLSGFNLATPVIEKNGTERERTVSEVQKDLENGTDLQESGKLELKGGTVTAHSFLGGGGSGDTEIKQTGGTLAAGKIGSTDTLYGFAAYTPKTNEEYIYTYSRIPGKATVHISGGSTEVSGYLGGMNSEVTISDEGKVSLGSDAVLGMTEAQVAALANDYKKKGGSIEDPGNENCKVTITGGTVTQEVASGSSDNDKENSGILAPYGSVEISGADTRVSVANLIAANGTVRISKASGEDGGEYRNPYAENNTDKKHGHVAILISNRLGARDIQITDGAVVYAERAIAEVPAGTQGGLVVQKIDGGVPNEDTDIPYPNDTSIAYLYTGTYGAIGSGEIRNDYYTVSDGQGKMNVFSTQIINIQYVLNPAIPGRKEGKEILDMDTGKIQNGVKGNPEYYEVVKDDKDSERKIKLEEASCPGYYFLGWYTDPEFKGSPLEELDRINRFSNGITLYARWERAKVPFEIRVTLLDPSEANDSMRLISSDGTSGTTTYTYAFRTIGWAEYGSALLDQDAVYLSNYATRQSAVNYVKLSDSYYEGGDLPITANNNVVTQAIVEAYQQKYAATHGNAIKKNADVVGGDKGDISPLTLMQTGDTKLSVTITFDMNLIDKVYPITEGRSYHNGNTKDDAKTSLNASIYVDGKLLDGVGFADADNSSILMQPVAPGYTFDGWYTDGKDFSDSNKVDANTEVEKLSSAGKIRLYAQWTPKTYTVRFAIPEDEEGNTVKEAGNSWITPGNERPGAYADGNEGNKELYYTWTYDTTITGTGGHFQTKADSSYKNIAGDTVATSGGTAEAVLPTAWREGFVFKGWAYKTASGAATTEGTSASGLDRLSVATLDLRKDENKFPDPDTTNSDAVLTLEAQFEKASVTYHVTQGSWKQAQPEEGQEPVIRSAEYTTHLAYGTELDGCTVNASDGAAKPYTLVSLPGIDSDGAYRYGIIQTAADYFEKSNNTYYTGDFREKLVRKGYSFAGWRDSADGTGALHGGAPRFENLEVWDSWTANGYILDIYGKSNATDYDSDFSTAAQEHTGFGLRDHDPVKVKVGDPVDKDSLPSRDGSAGNGWYAMNKNVNPATDASAMRFLLGVTFAPLDPGQSAVSGTDGANGTDANATYTAYAAAINNMYSSGSLIQEGENFFLPEDTAYQKDLAGTSETDAAKLRGVGEGVNANNYSIPDYPDGSHISMYGVYRERSLVLVERYIYDGAEHRRITDTGPWDQYLVTTDKYTESDIKAVEQEKGLSFKGWYVNTQTIKDGMLYPIDSNGYDTQKNKYKDDASSAGTYDIMVYTVYLPKDKKTLTLDASPDPKSTAPITASYTLPGSMNEGYMGFTLDKLPEDFNLVPAGSGEKDGISKHLLEESFTIEEYGNGKEYSANKAVAITMEVKPAAGSSQTYDLAEYVGQDTQWLDTKLSPGDTVTLRLYHSNVMTDDKLYTLGVSDGLIHLVFDSRQSDHSEGEANALEGQTADLTLEVKMCHSLYTVNYKAILPEAYSDLEGTLNLGQFALDTGNQLASRTVHQALADGEVKYRDWAKTDLYPAPAIGHYSFKGWTRSQIDAANGVLYAEGRYAPDAYTLKADAGTLNRWEISYTELAEGSTDSTLQKLTKADSAGTVGYHAMLTFTPKAGAENEANEPAYVTLRYMEEDTNGNMELKETCLLSEFKKGDAAAITLQMPAYHVEAVYSTVKTLYLDEGSISIDRTSYKQEGKKNGDPQNWPTGGSYVILQNAQNSTEENTESNQGWKNTLSLNGDLSARDICLGNVKILADNAIQLGDGANARLSVGGDALQSAGIDASAAEGGSIEARNISVPGNAEFSLEAGTTANGTEEANRASVTLKPQSGKAAIGGNRQNPASGEIHLENLALSVTLPRDGNNDASGIGPGSQKESSSSGDISMKNCEMAVTIDTLAVSNQYEGVWVGGAGVKALNLEGTTVQQTQEKAAFQLPAKAVYGGKVTIVNSNLGNQEYPLFDAVNAVDSLEMKDSSVWLSKAHGTLMIGTDEESGTIDVERSSIQVAMSGTDAGTYYTGVMRIHDTYSDVCITDAQVLELSLGDIKITKEGVKQGDDGTGFAHSGNYLLLEELATQETLAPSLTVTSINDGRYIMAGKPGSGDSDASPQETPTTAAGAWRWNPLMPAFPGIVGSISGIRQILRNIGTRLPEGNPASSTGAWRGNALMPGLLSRRAFQPVLLAGGNNSTIDTDPSKPEIDKLTVSDGCTLILRLNTDFTVSGVTRIAGDENTAATLNVESNGHKLTLAGGFADNTRGSFSQKGGELAGGADKVLAVGGNMTLLNVTANLGDGKSQIGSLCVGGSDGAVVGSDGAVTTVRITGGSITAGTIGALGDQDETFTFVELENDGNGNAPAINGKVLADWYCITYDTGGLKLNPMVPTVYRTEYTANANEKTTKDMIGGGKTLKMKEKKPGVPEDPTGEDEAGFNWWYYKNSTSGTEVQTALGVDLGNGNGYNRLNYNTEKVDDEIINSKTKVRTIPVHISFGGPSLPSTGGTGTRPYMLAGILLLALALAAAAYRGRRRA